MRPEVGTILGLSAQKIASGIGEGGAMYAAGTSGLLGMMLSLSAKEYDRAADIRVAENGDLRALFGELASSVADAGLKAKLNTAAESRDESLRISEINENNYALRRLLTELQIHVENNGPHESEKHIWTALKVIAARRVITLGP